MVLTEAQKKWRDKYFCSCYAPISEINEGIVERAGKEYTETTYRCDKCGETWNYIWLYCNSCKERFSYEDLIWERDEWYCEKCHSELFSTDESERTHTELVIDYKYELMQVLEEKDLDQHCKIESSGIDKQVTVVYPVGDKFPTSVLKTIVEVLDNFPQLKHEMVIDDDTDELCIQIW